MARLLSYPYSRVLGHKAASSQHGLTLIELMIGLAVGAVLLSLAIPNFASLVEKNRIAADTNSLATALNTARNAAVERETWIVLCPSDQPDATDAQCKTGAAAAKDWSSGWLMYAFTTVTPSMNLTQTDFDYQSSNTNYTLLQRNTGTYTQNVLNYNEAAGDRHLIYRLDGTLKDASTTRFSICDSNKEATGKLITISAVGQTSISNTTATPATDCAFQ